MNGWIKINRAITEHWLWQDAERLKWWFDLLFLAAWEDKKVMHDTHVFTLHRGQIIAPVAFLSERWEKSRPTVIRYLKLLEEDGMVKRETLYRQTSIITICNYDKYQCAESAPFDTIVDTMLYTLNRENPRCKVDGQNKGLKGCKTEDLRCKTEKELDTQVDTIFDTMLYTNKEYKEYNIPSSLRSEGLSDFSSDSPNGDDFDVSKIVDFWNSEIENQSSIIPKIRSIQGKRKNHIIARCRECGKDAIIETIRKAAKSDFLNGKNTRGWIANIDWVFLPTNFQKVLEGNYDNHSNRQDDGNPKQERENKRRGTEVTATKAKDYEGAF